MIKNTTKYSLSLPSERDVVYSSTLWKLACDCSEQESMLKETLPVSGPAVKRTGSFHFLPLESSGEAHLEQNKGPSQQPAPTCPSCESYPPAQSSSPSQLTACGVRQAVPKWQTWTQMKDCYCFKWLGFKFWEHVT